jgi:hypothetical protein
MSRVIVISFARLPSVVQFNTMEDPSWDAAPIAIWSNIEINVAIVCACGMTLRPLAGRFFPDIFSDGFQHHRENNGEVEWSDSGHPSTIGTRRQKRVPDDGDFNMALESITDADSPAYEAKK